VANISGQQYFRAVNLSRYAQGLGKTYTVPAHTVGQFSDAISVSQTTSTLLTWTRPGVPPSGTFNAIFYYRSTATTPVTMNGTRRMHMAGCLPIVLATPLAIDSLFTNAPLVWTGCIVNLAVALTQTGGVPFTLVRCHFTNVLW